MALDSVELDALAAGDDVATDLISLKHYQYVKHAFGADGTANIVTSTATNPLPVALSDVDNAVLDTIDAVLDTINAKLVTGTVIGDVNLGATDNAVLDTINTAVELIDNAVYVENAALGATPSGNLVMARQDAALTATGSVDDDATPLTVDANGALWVIPSGTVTVAGTVTANPASGTIDTVTTVTTCNLAAETTKVIGTVNVAAAQTIAATNAGTFATQVDGAALTALQLIDNSIIAHDAAATGATGLNVAGARASNSVETITEVANADVSHLATDLTGVLITRPYIATQEHVQYHVVNTAGTELTITGLDAGGAGIHNFITSVIVHNSSAATNGFIQLLDGTGGTPFATFPAPATGGSVINFTQPLKQPTSNTACFWDASAAITTLYVTIIGYQGQG